MTIRKFTCAFLLLPLPLVLTLAGCGGAGGGNDAAPPDAGARQGRSQP